MIFNMNEQCRFDYWLFGFDYQLLGIQSTWTPTKLLTEMYYFIFVSHENGFNPLFRYLPIFLAI